MTGIRSAALAAAFISTLAPDAMAQQPLKIGLITSLSGPEGVLGAEIRDAFNLGLKMRGGMLGGVKVEVVLGDDQTKPDVARQLADKMMDSDRVKIITGPIFSNVLLGIAKPVLDNGLVLVSANAGPSELAGKQCHRNFFSATWQNDNAPEAMGAWVQQKGVKRVYIMAPNYPAGKDKLTGFKRYFKGEIAGEVYTQFGQLDYAAEISQLRAAKPEGVFVFYPGGMGINFVKQYQQAGLLSQIPLYGEMAVFDQTVLPAIGDVAIGGRSAMFWTPGLDNPANKTFVEAFEKDYNREPSPYAAQAYDTASLLDAALTATGGKADAAVLSPALEKARFDSVRGSFKFNTNHFPIQDWYAVEVVKDPRWKVNTALREKIFTDHGDVYAKDCVLK
jgi:branched-chain amino acid transport system substrate-binding protein